MIMSESGQMIRAVPAPGAPEKLSVQEATEALFGERSGESETPAAEQPKTPPSPPRRGGDVKPDEEAEDKPEGPSEPEKPDDDAGAAEPEQPEPPPAAATAADDPEYEIRVGDKVESVKLSELQNGYLRQQDYSRKTAEVASFRRGYEAEIQGIRDERAQYAKLLPQLKRQIETGLKSPEDMARLEQLDPVGFLLADKQQQRLREQLSAVDQEESRLREKHEYERQQWVQQARADASSILLQRIPTWQQEEVRNREVAEMTKIGTEVYGYTMQELSQILDPRFVLLARDAMLYQQGKGKTNGVTAKRVTPQPGRPVPAKRSVPQSDVNVARRDAAQQRFNRSPTLNSAVDAILAERGET